MSKGVNPFQDSVFSLPAEDFALLQDAIAIRLNKEKYGSSSFEELAEQYGRKAVCPSCGSCVSTLNGKTPDGKQRYICTDCGQTYTLLSESIFHSTNRSFDTWVRYLVLMTFNVPLEMTETLCNISHPTAMLWRRKIFATVDGYQNHLVLRGRVWIDETYVFDSTVLHEDGFKRKRGLSKDLLCIVVAIDTFGNAYAEICGHGKPSSTRIYKTLKDHIHSGSTIVHDGEKAHAFLIQKLHCTEEKYIADNSPEYLKKMALINNMCAWLRRYLYRFIGMSTEYMPSYLNWFVYLYRVKSAKEKWPTIPRILRHLILTETTFKRKRP